MIAVRHTCTQNFDLALIGNRCAGRAGRPQRPHRVVVFPLLRFRSCLSRLRAGDEENVTLAGLAETQSGYPCNTAIVETVLPTRTATSCGSRISRPRFERFEWAFRPAQIIRIEPLAGPPRITAFGLLSEDISSGHQRGLG
jgi:hypothetical protein